MDACQEELKYEWFEAAKCYEQRLTSDSLTHLDAAESWRKIGFCYDLASRQAKDVGGFKELRQLAIAAYERAAGLFSKEDSLENQGKNAECLSEAEYLRSWIASDAEEKRKTLDKGRMLAKTALEAFEKVGNSLRYARVACLLSKCLFDRLFIGATGKEMSDIAREGLRIANDAISILSKLENKDELALAFSTASLQASWIAMINEEA